VRTGVLLVNSGTPDAAEPRAVRAFLARFLADRRVVDLPRALWLPFLYLLILPWRPRAVARRYRSIWRASGSPLRVLTLDLRDGLNAALTRGAATAAAIEVGMLYSSPDVGAALGRLRACGVERLVVLPLFPQYCGATTGAVGDHVNSELRRSAYAPELLFIGHYHDDPAYIEALRASVADYWRVHGRTAHLLMSFHGIPERRVRHGDPYFGHCRESAALLARALQLAPGEWSVSFQSRFGPAGWLKPYTSSVLAAMPAGGTREVTVICPGFAVDCLETLEEIAIENRKLFLHAGGQRYEYVPALNASTAHAACLAQLIGRRLGSAAVAAPGRSTSAAGS
jgi:protoporphyrin/coproporphyrin ferrochelatase